MALHDSLRGRLRIPAICAPMFLVSGPDLVREACKAGVVGALPRQNARSLEQFESWLSDIRTALDAHEQTTGRPAGPIAVNLATQMPADELDTHLKICEQAGARIIISALGDPTALATRVHDWGGLVFHDVTTMRQAEKAIRAGVDGVTCIGSGGGGHSGAINLLVLVQAVRAIFDGVIVAAGAISTGEAIRALEVLGADLAYLGTRFIATKESLAPELYKAMLVSETSAGLSYTGKVAGVPANWLKESLRLAGLDPDNLPEPLGKGMRHDHLPAGARPWKNIWSAGQGIDLIADVPSVAELVDRLASEYAAAARRPVHAAPAGWAATEAAR
ncbi:MAG: NAD(P)H-dependent flavin oxidoreductase [Caulobacterales bacterium]